MLLAVTQAVLLAVLFYALRGLVVQNVGADVTGAMKSYVGWKKYFLQQADVLVGISEGGNVPVPERVNTALQAHYTAWPKFLKIFWPAIFAACVVPSVLLSRSAILLLAFPGTSTLDDVDINEAVDCFLQPAGVVYAIFFGFVYSNATRRQTAISTIMAGEAAAVNSVLSMVLSLPETVLTRDQKRFIAAICRESLVEEVLEDIFGTGKTEIRAVFDSIDLDGNGELDREEMDQAIARLGLELSKGEIDQLMEEMDTDKNGTVDYGEFVAWERQDGRGLFKPLLRDRELPGMLSLVPLLKAAQHKQQQRGDKMGNEVLRQMLLQLRDNELNVLKRRAELARKTRPAQWAFLLILGVR